jgi:FLVCR family MFS transporter 7
MWLTFAPIPNFTASYYDVSLGQVNWFSMSFFAASLGVGFISIFVLNRFGLRVTVSI